MYRSKLLAINFQMQSIIMFIEQKNSTSLLRQVFYAMHMSNNYSVLHDDIDSSAVGKGTHVFRMK